MEWFRQFQVVDVDVSYYCDVCCVMFLLEVLYFLLEVGDEVFAVLGPFVCA